MIGNIPVDRKVDGGMSLRIGELADAVGVSTKTIRYYESIDLLGEPPRSASGYRLYDDAAVERLQFIRDAQVTGLSLTEIASILELKDLGTRSCSHTKDLLNRHLDDLDAQIRTLKSARTTLSALATRASGLDPAECTDPNRCQVISVSDAQGLDLPVKGNV